MRGRALDIKDPTQVPEGETVEIFVSRLNLYEDALDQLRGEISHDPSLPLEVAFNGECAQDLGGPRKEFLGAMVRAVKERSFVHTGDSRYALNYDVVAENMREYLLAGIVFGKKCM